MKTRRIIPSIVSEAGMTMIEVSIAAVVLMGAVITMMTMFDTSLDILRFTTARAIATQISNEALEDLRSIDFEQAVLYNSGTWPTDDPDLDTRVNPPLYKDRDDNGVVKWRPLLTTDTAAGIAVVETRERQRINFEIRRYVFYVKDATDTEAYKRLVVKAKWTGTGQPGEVVMTTNYALKHDGGSRPLVKIHGVKSAFYDHFRHTLVETTMGANETIHGPLGATSPMPAVSQPVVWTEAVRTGSKASYIKEVGFKLYSPAGAVLRETSVTSAVNGKYFLWGGSGALPLNTKLWPDGKGYVIRAEAIDDQGKKDVDALTINIDNAPPEKPELDVPTADFRSVKLSWTWSGSATEEAARFVIRRRVPAGGYTSIAAVQGDQRAYTNPGVFSDYWYQVRAVDAAGNFSNSDEKYKVSTSGGTDVTPPNITTSATVAALSWNKISVSWNQASDNAGGSGVGGYEVWAMDSVSDWIWTIVAVSTDTVSDPMTVIDAGLRPNKNYYYAFRTFDNEGNLSSDWYKSPFTTIYATTPSR